MKRIHKPVKVASSSATCVIKVIFLQLLLFSPIMSEALARRLPKQNNWFISGNTGIAMRSPELSGGFNFADDGFRHQPGLAFSFSFGRTLAGRWEPFLRWGAYTLFGQSDLPHYSSVGYYAAYPGLLKQKPLEYITQCNSLSILVRYILISGNGNGSSPSGIRPFFEAGVGINNYVMEVRYSKIPPAQGSSLIFRDRNGNNVNGTAQLTTGFGIKIGSREDWNAVLLLNADWMNFSTLNAVSQMTNNIKSSSRAVVARVTAGLAIPIKRTVKSDRYMPFRW